MDFKKYQKESRKSAIYPGKNRSYIYPLLGLAGESGEVVEKLKHVFRDKKNKMTEDAKIEIAKEIGDVLWYLAQLSTELGVSLDKIATDNLNKLQSRQKRKKLLGRGDNR